MDIAWSQPEFLTVLNVLTLKTLDIEIEEQGGTVKECFFLSYSKKELTPESPPTVCHWKNVVRRLEKLTKKTVMQFNPGCCDTRKSKVVDTSALCINVLITQKRHIKELKQSVRLSYKASLRHAQIQKNVTKPRKMTDIQSKQMRLSLNQSLLDKLILNTHKL